MVRNDDQAYLNLTSISEELMSLAVDSITPPKRPPPLRPPRPPIISEDLLIMYTKNPINIEGDR